MNIKTKAFTLIEVLVVTAIISLLSSIVLAGLQDARNKAVASILVSEIRSLYQEADIYFLSGNQYASNESGVDGITPCPTTVASNWGFFGTTKGIELLNSIKQKTGTSNIYCAISPDSWAVFTAVYTPIFSQEKNNTAYAQTEPVLGYICFDSTNKTIRNDIIVSEGSDGVSRASLFSIKQIDNQVVCSPN